MRAFTYEGRHYHLHEMRADVDWRTHAPVQKPRLPVWVVGGSKQSQLRRAARWDGAVIGGSPAELRERKAAIEALRAAAIVRPYAEAGATWWLESMWESGVTRDYDMRTRVRSGPPRIS